MEEYTLLDCRLKEKHLEQEREFTLNNLRMVLASIINTTASKKSQIKKPEDIMKLPSDLIREHKMKGAKGKTIDPLEKKKALLEIKELMPEIELPF